MSDIAFAAVWRPGNGEQRVNWGLTGDEFKAKDTARFDKGLRITSLAIRNGRHAAVWRPGSGEQRVNWGLTGDEFKSKDTARFEKGLRITAVAVEDGRLAAVWRPGNGEQRVNWGLTGDEFKAKDTARFDKGLRITSLAVADGRLTAVWRPGSGEQRVHWGMTGGEFSTQDAEYFKRGLRITAVAAEDGRFAAVWRPGSGEQWWGGRRGTVDFETEDAAYFARGLRLACLDVHDDPVGLYRYPWTKGESFTVGQGNNNPDPDGSHRGSQAWAFDFNMPAGTKIRAARSGTVEWLQEDLTANFNPSLDEGPGNVPFEPGSRDNWGNAVRIRHAGGFTSWYFHLQANSVVVNVGDKVERGQVIARAGNTGRSSGPHLHFQVQADSVDWGQSVPITFGPDCEQPDTGDSVTSDNAP